MMELALIRTLMNKEFYERHKGIRCPDKIFTKDVRKIKQALDYAMVNYENSLSPSDLEAIFFSTNQSLTTANKDMYKSLFKRLTNEQPMNDNISEDVLSKLFQQVVGAEVANLGFDYVNGTANTLEPMRKILDAYQDDFTPNLKVTWEDISIDTLLDAAEIQSQWTFNIPSLKRKVEGISGGHFIIVGARPNTGKTSFHASLVAAPGGFAHQGAKCIVLCNEERYDRVAGRYLCAASSMSLKEVKENRALALSAAAEGIVRVDQSMLEGSKTGKAAEADLMILISKNSLVVNEGASEQEEDTQRHLVVAKNKLTGGWHGTIHCNLDGNRSQYLV